MPSKQYLGYYIAYIHIRSIKLNCIQYSFKIRNPQDKLYLLTSFTWIHCLDHTELRLKSFYSFLTSDIPTFMEFEWLTGAERTTKTTADNQQAGRQANIMTTKRNNYNEASSNL